MNIFFLSEQPQACARYHCSQHVIKMMTEYVQMLSTAHRVLDGKETTVLSEGGRRMKVFILPDEREQLMMKTTHVNHPCAVWVRASKANYEWLVQLVIHLQGEYYFSYGKEHASYLRMFSSGATQPPENIPDLGFTEPPQAMPEEFQVKRDVVSAYRNFYNKDKSKFAHWNGKACNREIPYWYTGN